MKIWVVWLSFIALFVLLIGVIIISLSINCLLFSCGDFYLSGFYPLLPKQSLNNVLWWIWGIYGIISSGLGIFLFYVALGPFNKVEKWAWLTVFISVMVWFTIGASISIMFLIYIDMIAYSAILILTLLPLLFTQKAFIIRRDLI